MPQIPTAEKQTSFPLVQISPREAAGPYEAIGKAAERTEGLGEYGSKVFDYIQRAKDNVQLLKIEHSVEADYKEKLQSFAVRSDYDNYETDAAKFNEEIKNNVMAVVDKNPRVQQAIGGYLNVKSREFSHGVRAKMLTDLEHDSEVQILKARDNAEEKIIGTFDPVLKNLYKNEFLQQVEVMRGSHNIRDKFGYDITKDLDKRIEIKLIATEDVMADKAIESDPKKASIDLRDSKYLPNLLPKQRQDKVEKADRASKVFDAEQEKRQKELEKKLHDDDDREVGNLFMKKQFTNAYNKAQLSKFLTGDEKRVWATSIESASKTKEDEIDPVVESINYAFVNELIAKEVDPKTIKGYIFSYEFTKGTRDKLIDRLDKETDTAVNKAKSRGYDYMKGQIMPYGGMFAEVPPLQSAQYTKAMNALDDWISKQRKADKPISPKDIQAKSEELALTFQTSIGERQDFTAKERKEKNPQGATGGYETQTRATQPAEAYERGQTYTDANGRKAKYMGKNKEGKDQWQIHSEP